MSDMKGNPHIEDYEKDLNSDLVEFDAEVMQLHATLALAYEQRTANLIALYAPTPHKSSEKSVQWSAISARLGLEGA